MTLDTNALIDKYVNNDDWRIKENSNTSYAYPGMLGYVLNHITSKYMLDNIYSQEVAEAHKKCLVHIHDLSGMNLYCLGLDYEMVLSKGLNDIDGPPKHFSSALSQTMNTIFLISQLINGAVAFNTFDVLLAPYAKNDKLTYKQLKQTLQEFIHSINIKGRIGWQSPFVNIHLDVTIPKRLQGRCPVIGGETMDFTYDECQDYAEWIGRAILEILADSKSVLTFPVVNIGITKDFNWDNKFSETLFETLGKSGIATINNYVSSDYDPDSVRSMCCSLKLDMRKISKQVGGSFGAADNSGSVGVVTLNLPLYAYLSKGDKGKFHELIDQYVELSVAALNRKREFIEKMLKLNMYPTLHRFIYDFSHFFSTIGVIGLREMCLNFDGNDIDTPEGKAFAEETLTYLNDLISEQQEANSGLYNGRGIYINLESIPGESTMYRFAKHMKEQYPQMILSGTEDTPRYTRGSWLDNDIPYSLKFAAEHQESLQNLFSGGACFFYYSDEALSPKAAKSIVRKLVNNTTLPYINITPTIRICPVCSKRLAKDELCEHTLTEDQIEFYRQQGIEMEVE